MAFDSTGKLYVTDFGGNGVTVFDTDGSRIGPFGGTNFGQHPESIVFDAAGNLLARFDVATETGGGSDWIDLAPDQCTLFYTSEERGR